MQYDTGTFGNHITEGDPNEGTERPVVTIPDDSVLFNPDWSWNVAKVRELISLLEEIALGKGFMP
jgi:hypothetical protein